MRSRNFVLASVFYGALTFGAEVMEMDKIFLIIFWAQSLLFFILSTDKS